MAKDKFWDGVHDTSIELEIVGLNAKETNRRLAEAPANLKSLCVDPSGSFDASLLTKFASLKKLVVTAWPSEDFTPLHRMRGLDSLFVARIKNVNALDSLTPLVHLERLTLEGFMIALRAITVKSFDPLGKLQRLKELSLWCVVPGDKRIDGLLALPPLSHLGLLDGFLTLEQWAQLDAHGHPMIPITDKIECPCEKCGRKTGLYLNASPRGKKKMCCPKCDAKRVDEHRAAYALALSQHRGSAGKSTTSGLPLKRRGGRHRSR